MAYTEMYLVLCRSSINGFSCTLNTLNFTADKYVLKNINVSPVTIAIFYSFVELDFIISHCNAFYLIKLNSNFERNYFVC